MNVRRLLLPAAALLSLLGLGVWAYAVFWPIMDIRVVNRSGAALTGLRVCLTVEICVERDELRPGRTWRVPLRIRGDYDAALTFGGLHDEHRANIYVTPGMGVHWTVRPEGRIEPDQ